MIPETPVLTERSVAGVSAPAFVERRAGPRTIRTPVARVAGVSAPFVERTFASAAERRGLGPGLR